ncbi:oligosaccharide flippase family protein [Thermocoleostomius sinensis]|uniref:Oligosaccharide flippase family protein n=1 Tax=Thermocoleostomius sinensis A174 TaxID=2016057 RepID=A0A9E9C7P9_9CYAN|nr:oligosaccharide flippase family protein [Thermocoleostomius sinensis]WAL59448.1 oligosaccharide flippase family protein [Thermocoleostomius sinensis A174]
MSNLKKRAVQGLVWTLVGYGGGQVLRLGGNLILTRLLFPEFFGLMALVNIFIMGLALFSDVGIGVSIIQNKRGEEPDFANTAWTIQVIRGFGLWLVCLLMAAPMAQFYNEPQLQWLIPVVGLTTVIGGFNSTAFYLMERNLAVRQLTLMELVTQIIQLVVMVIWAYFDASVWSLAVGSLVSTAIKTIWSFYLIPGYSNRFTWEKSAARELFSIGRWIFVSTAFTFLAEQADRLLLGKLFSLELLGVYGIALMLSDVPRSIAISLGGKVIFPAVSMLIDLPRYELRSKLLRNRKPLLLGLTAMMMLLISFGDYLIYLLYDERYEDAAWMLPILALGIWPRLLCSTVEASLTALGKVHYTAIGNFTRMAFTIVGILVGFAWLGNLGAVLAVALNDLFYYAVVTYGLHREKIGCLTQDIQATGLLFAGLVFLALGRVLFGLSLPLQGVA